MLIQWCLKGIPERLGEPGEPDFGDAEARAAVDRVGLRSTWLRRQGGAASGLPSLAQPVLSQPALDAHVNGFAPGAPTPYLSLSAGATEIDPVSGAALRTSALQTALGFATGNGRCDGYVFRLWTLVSPKPAAELAGFAEEVRDLNLFRQFTPWHHEGEIAAKLYVPARQIESVTKYSAGLAPLWSPPAYGNPAVFVPPERISTIVAEV